MSNGERCRVTTDGSNRDTPSEGALPDQFTRIEEALKGIDTPLKELVAELRRVDSRSRAARTWSAVGVIVGCVGVAVGIGAMWYGLDARATAEDIIAARTEARVSACIAGNQQLAGTREAIAGVFLIFGHPDASGHLPPPEQEVFDHIREQVGNLLPDRDCSPEGIAAFYDHSIAPVTSPVEVVTSSSR